MFSGLETLANIRPVLLGGAAVALMAGWGLFFTRRARSYCAVNGDCLAPTTSVRTATLLGLGTAIIGLALVWEPFFEPMLLKFVR